MKKTLLIYCIASLFLASCSTTIERNATAFGGGWGMSEKKETSQVKEFNDDSNQTKEKAEKTSEILVETQNQNAHAILNTSKAETNKKEISTSNDPKISHVVENGNSVLDASIKEKEVSKKSSKLSKTIAKNLNGKSKKSRKAQARYVLLVVMVKGLQ